MFKPENCQATKRTHHLVYTKQILFHVLQFGNNFYSFCNINAISNTLIQSREKVFGNSFRYGTYLKKILLHSGV